MDARAEAERVRQWFQRHLVRDELDQVQTSLWDRKHLSNIGLGIKGRNHFIS